MARALVKTHSSSSIGSVKQSVLTEAQFQTKHGLGWILMDGRDVTGSDYDTLVFAGGGGSIPDARGQFLRGKDHGVGNNPDGDTAIGTVQNDNMQGHMHNLRFGAGASASYNITTNVGPLGGISAGNTDSGIDLSVDLPRPDGVNGTPRTGLETRPKNITVNIFVKINEA